jgi:hypothetical protein
MFMEEAKSCQSYSDIVETHTKVCAKYHSFAKEYLSIRKFRNIPRWRKVTTTVYWGWTGLGKTRKVYFEHPDVYKLDPCGDGGKVWWCGYDGEDTILIDDFYGWIEIGMLLNILDGYPLRLNIKNGRGYAAWTKVCMTSNMPPHGWYSSVANTGEIITSAQRAALNRRLTNVINVTENWFPPEPLIEQQQQTHNIFPFAEDDEDRMGLGAEALNFGGELE